MAQLNSDDTKKQLTQLVGALDEEMLLSLLVKNLYDNFELLFFKVQCSHFIKELIK